MAEFIANLIILIVFSSPFFALWLLVRFIKKKNKNQSKNKPHYFTSPETTISSDYQQNNFSNVQGNINDNFSRDFNNKFNMNNSKSHVDFMIGTKDLNIKGITQDNKEIDIFINGNFTEEFN